MALSDIQTLVEDKLRDTADDVSDAERDRAIEGAVARYSLDRPRKTTLPIAATATTIVPLPAGWQDGFSQVTKLELATDMGSDSIEGTVNRVLGNDRIDLETSVQVGTNVYVTYTLMHILTEEDDTIPALDRAAVAMWATAELLDQRANLKTDSVDPTIAADSVDHHSKGANFARLARDLRARYFDHLGIDKKRNVAAGVIVDLDKHDQRGYDRLVHTQRRR